jgi:hypothetical protein
MHGHAWEWRRAIFLDPAESAGIPLRAIGSSRRGYASADPVGEHKQTLVSFTGAAMERPTGVTILAVLTFIGAGFLLIVGILFFAGGAMLSHVLATGPGASMLLGVGGAVLGSVLLVLGIVQLAIAVGLLKLQNWARILLIVFVALSLLSSGGGLLFSFAHIFPLLMFRHIVTVAIDIWILIYLLKPHVKQAFGASGF